MHGAQQVMTIEQGTPVCILIMTFNQGDVQGISTPLEDSLVVELKIESAIVCRILVDTGGSANIIT